MAVASKTRLVVAALDDVPVEVLATAIRDIAEGVKKLLAGPLNEKGLLLLIQHAASGTVSQRDIKAVLQGIRDLDRTFLKVR